MGEQESNTLRNEKEALDRYIASHRSDLTNPIDLDWVCTESKAITDMINAEFWADVWIQAREKTAELLPLLSRVERAAAKRRLKRRSE